jgi:hypothetical protein
LPGDFTGFIDPRSNRRASACIQTRMTFLASRRFITPLILALIASVFSLRAHLADQPWTRHVIDASSRGADGVRTADVNSDGIPDLVVGWEQGGLTRVYVGSREHTEGPRWRAVTVGQSPDVEDAAFFDADGDGSLDIVSSTEGRSRKILVHWSPSRERYTNEHEWKTEVLTQTDLNGCSPCRWTSIAAAASTWSPAERPRARRWGGSSAPRSRATSGIGDSIDCRTLAGSCR